VYCIVTVQVEYRTFEQRVAHPDLTHGVVVRVTQRGVATPDVYVLREKQLQGSTVTGGATHQGAINLSLHDLDSRLPRAIAVSVPYDAILQKIDDIAYMQAELDVNLTCQPEIPLYSE